ncbi:MAG: PIG-L family deacetylase [Phycisphaerales bacterium]
MILAPHPDDEVLGCAGIVQKAVAMNVPVHIVFFTYGDFYEWSFVVYKKRPVLTPKGVEGMGELRHDEAIAAAAALGLARNDLTFLGYPDFGTLDIWYSAWESEPPVKGILTKATAVPYKDAFRPGAPHKGEEVLHDLASLVRQFRPTKVFVSHPADHHPDHRALYLFTRVCLFDLEQDLSAQVYPYLVHYTNWPTPQGHHPEMALVPPGILQSQAGWSVETMSPPEMRRKRVALRAHHTQYETTPRYLDSFVRSNELFGDLSEVELRVGSPARSLSGHGTDTDTSEVERMGEQDALLVGIVERTVRIVDGDLVLSMELTHPLAKEVGASVYLFGWRSDRPFARMPKLHVRLGPVGHEVHDMTGNVTPSQVGVVHAGRHMEIRLPLAAMGNPRRVFTDAQICAGAIPLEWAAWQTLDIGDAAVSLRDD